MLPVNVLQQLNEQWRTLPQLASGKLRGLTRGSELALTLDIHFAAREHFYIGQTEALMAIVPGGGATAYLPRLIGRARPLEAIAGAPLYDADLAERYGCVNRALAAADLDGFVSTLARQLAALAPGVARAAKQAVDSVHEPLPVAPGRWSPARRPAHPSPPPKTCFRSNPYRINDMPGQEKAAQVALAA